MLPGAAVNLNASSNFNTNINTGTSTGTVTVGSSTASQTVNIGTGTAAATVNIATGNVAGNITIGDNTGPASSTVKIGGTTTINGAFNLCIDNSIGGTDTYTATNANITNLTTGLVILFNPLTDNTTACTLNLNGTGAISIYNQDGTSPATGDLQAGGYQFLVYTGTSWLLIGRN